MKVRKYTHAFISHLAGILVTVLFLADFGHTERPVDCVRRISSQVVRATSLPGRLWDKLRMPSEMKNFDFNKWEQARDNYSSSSLLPDSVPVRFEEKLALLEIHFKHEPELGPHLNDLIRHGSPRDQRHLAGLLKRFNGTKGFTKQQLDNFVADFLNISLGDPLSQVDLSMSGREETVRKLLLQWASQRMAAQGLEDGFTAIGQMRTDDARASVRAFIEKNSNAYEIGLSVLLTGSSLFSNFPVFQFPRLHFLSKHEKLPEDWTRRILTDGPEAILPDLIQKHGSRARAEHDWRLVQNAVKRVNYLLLAAYSAQAIIKLLSGDDEEKEKREKQLGKEYIKGISSIPDKIQTKVEFREQLLLDIEREYKKKNGRAPDWNSSEFKSIREKILSSP